tara:strand:- start:293 stop:1042 length:750 start_codon:yes stop_codon:yes gene_type:complete
MKIVELEQVQHEIKIGQECPTIIPNIKEDCIFMEKGVAVGFFLNKMPDKAAKLAELADFELRGKNVPKSSMKRSSGVEQFSCIIGSIPPKPHMRRPYPAISSVHGHKSAKTFIKSMIMLGKESEQIIKDILPAQYEEQMQIFSEMDDKWKLGNMFTSSISNYNISAPFHRDTGNIKNTVNVIITKRKNSTGGNLHIPDYNATVDQCDGSMLVYPAWRNVHGVTPIHATHDGGYRNSLVFYPLKAFMGIK